MKRVTKIIAICACAMGASACSDPSGPTGRVVDLKSGAIAIELRGWGDGTIGVYLSSVRNVQDKQLATWFTIIEGRTTGYFTTEFDCDARQAKLLQFADQNGNLVRANETGYAVLPKTSEEVVMNYLCPSWWEFWK